ncbi:ATP-binding protein [Dehalococcoidia bacterium]|nr:ATP-binding protein [Dehalococcoidia bacterium]
MVTAATVTAPRTISMEEFRREWEPEGWRLIIIGPTSTWRQEWGMWSAIRDVVQNSLDEAESYTWGFDEKGLWIKDQGQGVQVADFLLGPPRTKPPHARGRFGEGMKIAALVMLREGYAVKIDTVGREVWMIFLKQEINGTAEVLAAMWRPNGRPVGTRFHIIGYFGDDYKWNFAVNIPKEFIIHEGPSQLFEPIRRFNQLISSPSGKIYARDIYMREITSPYSYNLWGFEMAPDRHGPKLESDMWVDMGRLWATCKDKDLLRVLFQMVSMPPVFATDESVKLSMSSWDMGFEPVSRRRYTEFMEDNKKVWQDAWKEAHGENAVLRQSDRWDSMVIHLGYKSVSVTYGVEDALSKVILTDAALIRDSQERLAEVEIIPDEELTERQRAHLRLARKIAEKTLVREITGVHAAIIPPASDRMRTAGLYSAAAEAIYIAADQLNTARATVDVLIHEMAHHTSGREDGDPAHNAQMTSLGARVVQLTAGGRFDEELKEAMWY